MQHYTNHFNHSNHSNQCNQSDASVGDGQHVPARLEMPRYADRAVVMTSHDVPYVVAETQGLVRPDEYMVRIDNDQPNMHADWATNPLNPMVSLSYLTGRVRRPPARDLQFV